ncbi:single-stranded-DNA-specific exonuclease RecJ [Patescibacteria group bacterium]|nr:single-stranded-DNA-specific exonuclease RecJ [Patescibacteria group bacterium]MBU4512153.1 single-stranded-DNA-specific exonuclease RecJ [Patescibacteria group bacterium]MCG2693043.1 single-stranded-DNA-specific exonuclease RecJ [Candidatus Parcubacteria bacterium]
MQKQWKIKEKISDKIKNEFPEVNSIILQLLYNRGLTKQKDVDEFLNPDYGQDSHDPFLFKDMEKAVARIGQAIERDDKVLVYGDYDADGVCSSVVLYEIFKKLDLDVEVYLPHREKEGYGLNMKACDYIIGQGVKLAVTVDCGISNKDEIKKLQDAGIDVIILDHHHPPAKLPKAYAIIDAKVEGEIYPFKELAGVGVAFKFVQALVSKGKLKQGQEKWFLDLVALATVADCCSLLGENRTLVKWGMVVLNKTKRLGLQELIKAAGRELGKIDTYAIGYQLAPRINAAGRMNHANGAFKLLISKNAAEAEKLALGLNKENVERQKLTDRMVTEAKAQIEPFREEAKLIFVINPEKGDWPPGVVGLVAGKLCEQYHRPTLALGRSEDGKLVGSGRSIDEFNIIKAVTEASEYLSHFGGHSGACGFTIKSDGDTEPFKQKMIEIAESQLKDIEPSPVLEVDAQVGLREVSWELFEQLENFEPFGDDNLKPRFLAKDLEVADFSAVGSDGKHMRLMLNQCEVKNRKTIGFGFGDWCGRLKVGDKVDMVFEVDVNEWNGNRELQMKIVDMKLVTGH